MKKINTYLNKNINKILLIYIIIQPFLDIITGINKYITLKNIPFAPSIRLLFMILCIYYTLFINPKKEDIKKLIISISYMILFIVITFFYKGKNVLVYETTNLLNTFYLPIVFIGISKIFKEKKLKINIKLIIKIYLLYIILIIIPNITKTGFNSYEYGKVGQVGWFPLANIIGNLLCITTPFIIYYILTTKKQTTLKIILIISSIYVFCSMGTKVPILGLIICITINLLFYIKKWIKEKKYKQIIIISTSTLLLIIPSIIIIPKTNFYKNLEIHKEFLQIDSYLEIFTKYELIDSFIFSQRLTFFNTIRTQNQMNIVQKIVGIGYIKTYDNVPSTKTIEIDYLDLFYQNGIAGILIFCYILLPTIKKSFSQKNTDKLLSLNNKISVFLMLIIALFAGHILISPAIGTFVAIILNLNIGGIHENIEKRQI